MRLFSGEKLVGCGSGCAAILITSKTKLELQPEIRIIVSYLKCKNERQGREKEMEERERQTDRQTDRQTERE